MISITMKSDSSPKVTSEWLRARYVEHTDEVLGVSKGSLLWLHELRHREQFSWRGVERTNHFLGLLALVGKGLFLGAFFLFYWFAPGWDLPAFLVVVYWVVWLLWFPVWAFSVVLEIDAWRYAVRHKRGVV